MYARSVSSPCAFSRPKEIATDADADFSVDQVGWRTLIPVDRLRHIPDLPVTTTSWWYGKAKSLWLSPVDELTDLRYVEFSARVFNEPPVAGKMVSWGIPISNAKVFSCFDVGLPHVLSEMGLLLSSPSSIAHMKTIYRTVTRDWLRRLGRCQKAAGWNSRCTRGQP